MNKATLFASTVALAVMSMPAVAEIKIGFINFARLIDEAPQAAAAQQAMQQEFAGQQRVLTAQQKELRGLEEKLTRDGAVMSETERRDTDRRIRELQRDMSRRQQEYVEDVNLRRNEELGKIQRLIQKEAQAYAVEQNYDLVIGDGIFYASSSVDITEAMLRRLERVFRESGGRLSDGNR
ncbi:MAG: OmpH family outer membrane protein [Gammaproteobacteria bacterium]